MSVLTPLQVRSYAQQAGFTGSNLDIMTAVAMAESGGDTSAVNSSDPYGGSFGLVQINASHFTSGSTSKSCALDPSCAMQYAYKLWQSEGFKPWGSFTDGRYQKFLSPGSTSSVLPGSTSGVPINPLSPLSMPNLSLASFGLPVLGDWLSSPVRIVKLVAGLMVIGIALYLLVAPEAEQAVSSVAKVAAL